MRKILVIFISIIGSGIFAHAADYCLAHVDNKSAVVSCPENDEIEDTHVYITGLMEFISGDELVNRQNEAFNIVKENLNQKGYASLGRFGNYMLFYNGPLDERERILFRRGSGQSTFIKLGGWALMKQHRSREELNNFIRDIVDEEQMTLSTVEPISMPRYETNIGGEISVYIK